MPITIVIADDHLLYRQALAGIITKTEGFQLPGHTGSGAELLLLVKQYKPDIVLLDIKMPGMDGMETCRRLLELQPGIGVIAITMHNDETYISEMLKAGALAYLLKDEEEEGIISTIKTVYQKGTHFDPSCTPVLTDLICGNRKTCKLNEAQKWAMTLIGQGYKSGEMTGKLNKGIDSVNLLRKSLYPACGVKTLADLFKCGIRCRLINPEKSGKE